MYRLNSVAVFAGLVFIFMISAFCNEKQSQTMQGKHWIATWSTAQQLVEPRNNPPQPGLSNNTLRQVVRVSIAGDSLRMSFSNAFSTSAVTMNSVRFAISEKLDTIKQGTEKTLTFNGKEQVTMEPGAAVLSDPFVFALKPRMDVAITIYFAETSADVTGHPGSRTTSYIVEGNALDAVQMPEAAKTDHWYVIDRIDVRAAATTAAVVVIGNSITDGRGSGTNKQNRWPDVLAERLQANKDSRHIAVINHGIGGNCVLRDCLGPAVVSRFDRDVLDLNGVRWLILFEGINDIGGISDAGVAEQVARDLIAAYEKLIDRAHSKGILVYGATLLPYAGSFYDKPASRSAHKTINAWIRTSGKFDAVIDLEKALEDPQNPSHMLPDADTGDHLHPNENGHRMIAEAIDLQLFK